MTVEEALREGARRLPHRPGILSRRREASWLLARAWGHDELWLRLHPEATLPDAVATRYADWLARRAAGEAAEQLAGRCAFWGRELLVTPEVLVPRPETELIVEVALELPLPDEARVLDVGTGSGCLAVTLAAERPSWRLVASDRSLAALAVARRNADRFGARVELLAADLASALAPPFDLVVANLPYLPSGELGALPLEVQHEPALALDGGDDGLTLVRRLLTDLPRLLRVCGGAILELGEDQAGALADQAEACGLRVARRLRDVSGCERVVVLNP